MDDTILLWVRPEHKLRIEAIRHRIWVVIDSDVFRPTSLLPGSEEKIQLMILRNAWRVAIHHPNDRKLLVGHRWYTLRFRDPRRFWHRPGIKYEIGARDDA